MGEARNVMNKVTKALFSGDFDTARSTYAPDVVADTPDAGEIKGPAEIVAWAKDFLDAFPDARYEAVREFECGSTAVDEGHVTGTNTETLHTPDGQTIPATGRSIRLRACDLATVENGRITSHSFYFDQMELLRQLGLADGQ